MFHVHFSLPAGAAVRARRGLGAGLSAAALLGAACACSSAASPASGAQAVAAARASASASPSPRGSASSGPIRITGAYLPQPASPDVAAVYFTVADTGDQSDTLLSATSVPAAQVALMSEVSSGGAESMTVVAGGLSIPAHGQLAFTTGGYHVMLTDPAVPLEQGGTVQLTLTFRRAGKVTLDVPITSLLSDAVTGSDATSDDATSMAGMPGM
ncbi:copper chaperone PCu(A)C [Actinospica durhamensis]|uniref:Copper chaperone PCu(A)C n=1 Tax=Actinospica durhamensis TaxID=1508375 RepID=A0A941ENF9_9ACTN|nr:copper chaperone PCu(A)C [Actinospica durhamensis]MBR7834466.1 copper chaperone PCu(A)C [Actinospica durhamensis]